MSVFDQYIKDLEQELSQSKTQKRAEEIGYVEEVKDGVALIHGLDQAFFGEIVQFESGVKGTVIDLLPEMVGVIVLGDYLTIRSGEVVKATGNILSVPISDEILGRVVNPLGEVLDGGNQLKADVRYPVEKIAPGVVERKSVGVPVQTGIIAIDALTPIGRGQRQLIIGDRGTGKTTVAIDTILNQKNENMICIYCAIGQKNSKVTATIELLKARGAMEYTIVVNASAADPATLQYIAPYSACAIGEYFMDKGKDVLVIYDDLTKHAYAYREVSLILRRPAGREAYPGDVFYLHSRLLERAARLSDAKGGGSLTALPFIETQANDVSAYIPTNVISITDGQIFLESDLFNAGVRPAINVGLSVSRVGGAAQTKAMKQVAGRLKLDLAQYRSMAAFAQFESELDEETKKFLARGARATEILKQNKYAPYSLGEQAIMISAVTKGFLDELAMDKIPAFKEKLRDAFTTRGKKTVDTINAKKVIDEDTEKEIEKLIKDTIALV
ncbi:MAG: F0F1 ATP synthase subunit alpha [Patescibacteria group bacterium]|nr:F0F1 ATP synthase subunit alpha [Patescibacteria group bacterium]